MRTNSTPVLQSYLGRYVSTKSNKQRKLSRLELVLCLSVLFILSSFSRGFAQEVSAWGDADATWSSSTLNDARSDYFQGEVIPFGFKTLALTNGSSYTFTIVYDYYNNSGNKNAGGYAYITTYNISRTPPALTGGLAPAIDNSFTGTGSQGVFYTQDADVTDASAPTGTDTKTVTVTFTYTGTTGGSAYIYWGMYLSKTGTVPDQGYGSPTNGAGHWPGGSLALVVSGTDTGGGNVGNNPGTGGVLDGVISGMKYSDLDKSGGKNGSESGLSGWTIYIDNDSTGTLTAGDISTTTDVDGNYAFHDLLPRTYHYYVREVNQPNWTQTQPGSGASYQYALDITAAVPVQDNKLFGNFTCTEPIVSGVLSACVNGTTQLSGDGTAATTDPWVSDATSIATVSSTGQVSGVADGTAHITYTNSLGCTKVVLITIHGLPSATANSNSPVCIGSTLNLTGGAAGLTYNWTGPNNYTNSTQSPSISNVTTAAGGTYTITVTDANSCTNTASTSVVVNARPNATASSNSPVCVGSTLNLTGGADGLTSYSWTGPNSYSNGTQSPSISNVTTAGGGTYTLTVTDANGCTNTASTSVVVNSLPSSTANSNSPVCAGSTLNLTGGADGLTSYSWTGPNSYSNGTQSPSISNVTTAAGGTYTITVTDGNGCTNTASTSVVVNSLPSPGITGPTPVCANSTGNVYSTESGMTSYTWSVTGGSITSGGTSTDNTVTVTWGAAGTGHVKVNYTNGNGCTAAAQTDKSVTINSLPSPGITGPTPVCASSTGNVYSTESGMTSYVWNVTGGTVTSGGTSTDNTVTVTWGAAGTGHVKVNYTNGNGCTAAAQTDKSVTINGLPTATASSNTPVCAGNTLNLTGGAAGLTYNWTGPNNYTNSTQSPSISNVTTAAGGTYTLKVTDGNNCTNTASTSVVVNRITLCGAYTGVYFANTGLTTTGGQATVNLVFNITGNGTCNNTSNLTKDVFNVTSDGGGSVSYGTATYSNGVYTIPATISLTSQQFSTSVNFTLNIASGYSNRYELVSTCTDQPMITVSSLAGDFVTGGGYIIPPGITSCTGTTTSLLKGAPNTTATANGLKNNFGFNIKWNKSLKNLQGNWNTVIRATDGHRYQVKSSQPSSLAITKLASGKYRADMVFSPVNFQDLSTGLWSDGGGSSRAQVTVIDNGEPGAGVDQIFISVYDKNGNLWYSSNTCTQTKSGSETTIAILNQGNIQVHNTTSTTPGTTRDVQTTATTLAQTFDVTATPNPSFSYFTLNIGGNNLGGLVNVKVTDVLGRVVETRQHLAPSQTVRIGNGYKPGIYIVEVQQGDTVKQLKLVKQ